MSGWVNGWMRGRGRGGAYFVSIMGESGFCCGAIGCGHPNGLFVECETLGFTLYKQFDVV